LADKAMSLWRSVAAGPGPRSDSIDPYHFERRATAALQLGPARVGPEQPPRVIVRAGAADQAAAALRELASPRLKETQAEGLVIPIRAASELEGLRRDLAGAPASVSFLVLELAPDIPPEAVEPFIRDSKGALVILRRFGGGDGAALAQWAGLARATGHFLAVDAPPLALATLMDGLRTLGDDRIVITYSGSPAAGADHSVGAYRRIVEELRTSGSLAPVWIRNTAETAVRGDNSFLSKLIEASFLTGSLLCDGVGDLVSIETEPDPARAARLTYNVLQGAGARISKAEFVACPSCGRTLFDLQTTTQRIRAQTAHLKGVKIAIMGCIVNGPGEMADADFGYVGGAPGKINLYVGKQCVQYNIPQADADARLIALIKEHKKWAEPEPAHA
jgi:(E)-4-hydroxy-3-methylbut-2-enyl-diphosphate synthase